MHMTANTIKNIHAPKAIPVFHYTTNVLSGAPGEEKCEQILKQVQEFKTKEQKLFWAVPKAGLDTKTGILCDGPVFAVDPNRSESSESLIPSLWIDKAGLCDIEIKQTDMPEGDERGLSLKERLMGKVHSLENPLITLRDIWASEARGNVELPKQNNIRFLLRSQSLADLISLYVLRMIHINQEASALFEENLRLSPKWAGLRRYCENLGIVVPTQGGQHKHSDTKDEKTKQIDVEPYAKQIQSCKSSKLLEQVQQTSEVIPGLLLKD